MIDHKIKTVEQIIEAIGARPRTQKAIMAHGVFDIVHPGHIRHLLYAKGKADILIVSLTTDAHIVKANYRPFIPQDLRALNLAALQMVDYVVVDDEPTPIKNIGLIQPDYFAKGFEYSHRQDLQEKIAVEAYGGELLFTPGDIVYSSSQIIETKPPALAGDKLRALLAAEGVSLNRLHATLSALKGVRVHVVGDTIIDSHTHCTLIGGMTKTPTLSVRHDRRIDFVGGAGVVAKHLRAAGAEVHFSTVLNGDKLGKFAVEDLEAHDIHCLPITERSRPTTHKNAIMANGYNLLKIDTLDNRSISTRNLSILCDQISITPTDIVVFSDFRHGIFNRNTVTKLIDAIPINAFRVADSQVASRWGNILDFPDFDLITPNEREARFALGDQDSVVRSLGFELHRKARCKTLMLKLGAHGLMTFRGDKDEDVRGQFTIDSFAENVVDPVGAGDALLAYATLALYISGNPVIASALGSLAAAIECEHEGNIPVSNADISARLIDLP
jgi:rfaE bifunctional protein kinase chain/domain/rfaE bifunctional protein nucleotidyltransferase chain/domain